MSGNLKGSVSKINNEANQNVKIDKFKELITQLFALKSIVDIKFLMECFIDEQMPANVSRPCI